MKTENLIYIQMPVEIREFVIQAQVEKKNASGSSNAALVDAEELEELVQDQVQSALADMKEELMLEMKIWVKEYMKKKDRKF